MADISAIPLGTYVAANPTVAALTRDSSGRIVSLTEDGVAESVTRDATGLLATVTVAGVTKTISRDSSGRIAGVA